MRRGVFISFEGSEGCGKSTQIGLLEARLREGGREVLRTREPGGTFVGERIRDLLQHTEEAENMTPEAELLLFAASRAQLVREVIAPALENGVCVIADRFLDSTSVYQGTGRGLEASSVDAINRFAVAEWMPDLTVLLDMDSTEAHSRAMKAEGGEPDRIERLPLDFFERVRQGYRNLAAKNPERIVTIDASGTMEGIADEIWENISIRLKKSGL